MLKYCVVLLMGIVLSSCSDLDIDFTSKSPEDIFTMGMDSLKKKEFKKASLIFNEVEKNYPYSDLAVFSKIISGYASYMCNQYDESSEVFNVFIQLHPGHPEAAYALYMRGICAYEQVSIVERDQESSIESLTFFNDLIDQFPKSKYAVDAAKKVDLIKDHLAGKEMDIGRFYMKTYAYIAAIKRFKLILEDYKGTRAVPEALYRLVESYVALGIYDQADIYFAILKKDFNKTVWDDKASTLLKKFK